jgi:predicted RNase H-like HicB family nuclease
MAARPHRKGTEMLPSFKAVIQFRDPWWIGWVEEVPGVNCQGATREELIQNLHSALHEAIEMNRADALQATEGAAFEEVSLSA